MKPVPGDKKEVGDHWSNICVTGIREGKIQNRAGKIFEEIMAENFPELTRHQNTIPESFRGNQAGQIPKKHTQTIKLLKTKVLKASGKKTDYIQRNNVRNYIRLVIKNNDRTSRQQIQMHLFDRPGGVTVCC